MKKIDFWNPVALLAGGTVFGAAAAWSAMPAIARLSGDWLGFYGSITGGLVGGLLGVGAGVLAWSAAQQQIEAQTRMLDFATAEHRSRLRKILANIRVTLVATEADFTLISRTDPAERSWDTVERAFAAQYQEIKKIATDPDIWRISDDIHLKLNLITRAIHLFNNAFAEPELPAAATEERDLFNKHAAYIIKKCRECIKLIDTEEGL